ncbi:MAG TPA: dihydroorotate dehydrogenase [Terriglobia bacterium]|nr:dihydroorotate dehydrogenase [Terriglobia bacterium]
MTDIGSSLDKCVDLGRKRIRGRFVIPSGIRCTHSSVIDKCFSEIDSIGVITTKSISAVPRPGYREPIYARYSSGSYVNAVGLSNPGAVAFHDALAELRVPSDKFLLVSIFGRDASEFAEAAKILKPVADGFELNMSCPHAAGYGLEIGQDAESVATITGLVARETELPVIVKLSATLPRLARTAQLAIEAGASGITVTNTIGPSLVEIGENPILQNRVGGLSGNAIRPLALLAVQSIRQAVGQKPIIIGMGGIGTAEHVVQFRNAGADLFGIGSALTGLDTKACCTFFSQLRTQLDSSDPITLGSDSADSAVPMSYHRCRVLNRRYYSQNLFELTLDRLPDDPMPGQLSGRYYFLCIPGIGEKPFAVYSSDKRTIVIKTVGPFTEYLAAVPLGDEIWLRGPYGTPFLGVQDCREYVLVGGGTGIASLLEIAYKVGNGCKLSFVLGARSGSEIFGLCDFERFGPVSVATDDGTLGHHGRVSALLEQILAKRPTEASESPVFVNCGPEAMVHACAEVQRRYVSDDRIVGSIEYETSCGVGICGKCASPSGHLSCLDGPFMPIRAFQAREKFDTRRT